MSDIFLVISKHFNDHVYGNKTLPVSIVMILGLIS